MEATGGYQRAVVEVLFRAGLAVAVVNPARVRQFARACGLLAKTDKLDARLLAVFGQRVQPRRYESKSEQEAVKCPIGAAQAAGRDAESRAKPPANHFPELARLGGKDHRGLERRKETPGGTDRQYLNEQKAWQEQNEILSSAPGVGMVTTATLLAECRNWARWTARRSQLWWAWHP